jgi:hypothetical protein
MYHDAPSPKQKPLSNDCGVVILCALGIHGNIMYDYHAADDPRGDLRSVLLTSHVNGLIGANRIDQQTLATLKHGVMLNDDVMCPAVELLRRKLPRHHFIGDGFFFTICTVLCDHFDKGNEFEAKNEVKKLRKIIEQHRFAFESGSVVDLVVNISDARHWIVVRFDFGRQAVSVMCGMGRQNRYQVQVCIACRAVVAMLFSMRLGVPNWLRPHEWMHHSVYELFESGSSTELDGFFVAEAARVGLAPGNQKADCMLEPVRKTMTTSHQAAASPAVVMMAAEHPVFAPLLANTVPPARVRPPAPPALVRTTEMSSKELNHFRIPAPVFSAARAVRLEIMGQDADGLAARLESQKEDACLQNAEGTPIPSFRHSIQPSAEPTQEITSNGLAARLEKLNSTEIPFSILTMSSSLASGMKDSLHRAGVFNKFENAQREVRRLVADGLRQFAQDSYLFVPSPMGEYEDPLTRDVLNQSNFISHCDNVETTTMWATHLEISQTARIFDATIFIWKLGPHGYTYHSSVGNGKWHIHVGFQVESHYDLLFHCSDSTGITRILPYLQATPVVMGTTLFQGKSEMLGIGICGDGSCFYASVAAWAIASDHPLSRTFDEVVSNELSSVYWNDSILMSFLELPKRACIDDDIKRACILFMNLCYASGHPLNTSNSVVYDGTTESVLLRIGAAGLDMLRVNSDIIIVGRADDDRHFIKIKNSIAAVVLDVHRQLRYVPRIAYYKHGMLDSFPGCTHIIFDDINASELTLHAALRTDGVKVVIWHSRRVTRRTDVESDLFLRVKVRGVRDFSTGQGTNDRQRHMTLLMYVRKTIKQQQSPTEGASSVIGNWIRDATDKAKPIESGNVVAHGCGRKVQQFHFDDKTITPLVAVSVYDEAKEATTTFLPNEKVVLKGEANTNSTDKLVTYLGLADLNGGASLLVYETHTGDIAATEASRFSPCDQSLAVISNVKTNKDIAKAVKKFLVSHLVVTPMKNLSLEFDKAKPSEKSDQSPLHQTEEGSSPKRIKPSGDERVDLSLEFDKAKPIEKPDPSKLPQPKPSGDGRKGNFQAKSIEKPGPSKLPQPKPSGDEKKISEHSTENSDFDEITESNYDYGSSTEDSIGTASGGTGWSQPNKRRLTKHSTERESPQNGNTGTADNTDSGYKRSSLRLSAKARRKESQEAQDAELKTAESQAAAEKAAAEKAAELKTAESQAAAEKARNSKASDARRKKRRREKEAGVKLQLAATREQDAELKNELATKKRELDETNRKLSELHKKLDDAADKTAGTKSQQETIAMRSLVNDLESEKCKRKLERELWEFKEETLKKKADMELTDRSVKDTFLSDIQKKMNDLQDGVLKQKNEEWKNQIITAVKNNKADPNQMDIILV